MVICIHFLIYGHLHWLSKSLVLSHWSVALELMQQLMTADNCPSASVFSIFANDKIVMKFRNIHFSSCIWYNVLLQTHTSVLCLLLFQSSSFPTQFPSPSPSAFIFPLPVFVLQAISSLQPYPSYLLYNAQSSLLLQVLLLPSFIPVSLLSQYSLLLFFLNLLAHAKKLLTAATLFFFSFISSGDLKLSLSESI